MGGTRRDSDGQSCLWLNRPCPGSLFISVPPVSNTGHWKKRNDMPVKMKAKGLGSKKLKGTGWAEPGARCPPHTAAVPVNPLQEAAQLSFPSWNRTLPGRLPRGLGDPWMGAEREAISGQHGGCWYSPCTLGELVLQGWASSALVTQPPFSMKTHLPPGQMSSPGS